MDELDEIQKIIDEVMAQADKPTKSARQLAREYPHIPGLRMIAAMEAEGHQRIAEAAQYVNPYGANQPTGRPREGSVFRGKTI